MSLSICVIIANKLTTDISLYMEGYKETAMIPIAYSVGYHLNSIKNASKKKEIKSDLSTVAEKPLSRLKV